MCINWTAKVLTQLKKNKYDSLNMVKPTKKNSVDFCFALYNISVILLLTADQNNG